MGNIETGKAGEEAACDYLQKQGYRILERNYRTRFSEIDIVARDKEALVFIEVRSKVGEDFGSPEDTLRHKKLLKMRQNALAYAGARRWKGPVRVDAVAVVYEKPGILARIDHYKSVIE